MKVSKLINELKVIKKEEGDLDCYIKKHGTSREKIKHVMISNIESFPVMVDAEYHISLEN